MSYEKTNWTGSVLVTPARLRNIETQHEQSLPDARWNNTQFKAQVASAAPAGQTGRIYFNTGDNKLYGYDGAWILL